MEYWEIEMIKAKKAQEIKTKYPDVGKIVKFKEHLKKKLFFL